MNEFNYKKAWTHLALPEFDRLPPAVRALVDDTARAAIDLRQGKDLLLPWPDDGGTLRRAFDACENDALAPAAHVVHAFGHWAPRLMKQLKLTWQQDYLAGLQTAEALQSTGAYWKFSNYADQVLRARLGLARDHAPRGASFAVHEGVLRVCFSMPDVWTWKAIGWASYQTLALAREVAEPDWFATNRTASRHQEVFDEYVAKILANREVSESFRRLTDTERFMEARRP